MRPTVEKQLNPFCTELTGITDEQVLGKDVPDILGALEQSHQWLEDMGVFKEEFVVMSCGDFDCRQMKREAAFKKYSYYNYYCRWINLKKVFPKPNGEGLPEDLSDWSASFNQYGQVEKMKPTVKGMEGMLNLLGLELEGRHHSGIDDCRNLARCVLSLLNRGFYFNQAMVLNEH